MSTPKLAALLRDAVIQYRHLLPRQDDVAFIDAGGTILYAVDADVVKLFGNPVEKASTQKGRLGYGQVFSSDSVEYATAIASRLADYIFFEVSADHPLMVIPPIEYEIADILQALTEKVGSTMEWEIDVEKLSSSVEELKESHKDIPMDLLHKIQKIISLKSEAGAELKRLGVLLEQDRIASPEDVVGTYAHSVLAELFTRQKKISELFEIAILQKEWSERILHKYSHPPENRKLINIERDAHALAKLEWWNKQLTSANCKVLYITGSRHIFEAAFEAPVAAERNFAASYLRHPKTFLADMGALLPEGKGDEEGLGSFSDWLETFIGNQNVNENLLNGFELSERGRAVATAAQNLDQDAAESLVQRWNDFSGRVYAAYEPPEAIVESIKESLNNRSKNLIEEWESLRQELEARLVQELYEVWESCFRAATKAGWAFTFNQDASLACPARIPPFLRFDSSKTQNFLHEVSQWRKIADFDQNRYNAGIEEIQKEDHTGYAYYLSYATLFAGRGGWPIAAILCNRALERLEESDEKERGHEDGREAYYFRAFCLRHTPRGSQNPEILLDLLSKAKEIAEEEKEKRAYIDAVPERFALEELSIQTVIWMKERFSRVGGLVKASAIEEIIEKNKRIIDAIEGRIQENIENEDVRSILEETKSRAVINLASLLIHHEESYLGKTRSGYWDFVEKHLPLENRSHFGNGIIRFSQAVLCNDPKSRRRLAEDVRRYFLDAKKIAAIFPYDKDRFEFISKCAEKLKNLR